jgi:Flp pilus assembly protein TadG
MRRATGRARGERGGITIPLAIVFPAVLIMVLLVIQAGLWWYARQATLTAAREGSEAARAFGSSPAAGAERALSVIERIGTGTSGAQASSSGSSSTQVRITVTVRAASIVPGVPGKTITQQVVAPVERWTVPGGG